MKNIYTVMLLLTSVASNAQKFENLALTPPMGWNSWNTFQTNISDKLVMETADKIVSSGMKEAGYTYLVLDDGWMAKERDASGNLVPDPAKFPNGMKVLADYIHSKGLKFGLYNCAGTKTCAGYPGTRGYEYQDARLYASWGVDYLKFDWCYSDGINAKEAYTTMSKALRTAGHPIIFSLCEWGNNKPWEWAKEVGQLWRTTGDIYAQFDSIKKIDTWIALGVMTIVDKQKGLRNYAGPGHWNDPDMLEVGNGMKTNEDRAHFSIWCMLAAPLMAGNDIRKMSVETTAILTDKDLVAIDQDAMGIQGFKYSDKDSLETWFRPLAGGNWAVCFLNRSSKPQKLSFDWKAAAIADTMSKTTLDAKRTYYAITDLWAKKKIGTTQNPIVANIPAHDVLMLKLTSPGSVRVSQLGYYPNAGKVAIVTGDANSKKFYLLNVPANDTVYRGVLSDTLRSAYSTAITRSADFSAFKKPGNYILYVENGASSYPFSINKNVQHAVAVASLKGFYYQRVSMPLEAQYAGKWARPAGHPDNEVLIHPSAASDKRPAGTVISSPGGWYDAGDYNKYIVNSGITMGTLLSAYEDFPAYFNSLKTNIPESKDAVPDILNEVLYNLRWMLTMQDPNDGGVYNKCTNAAFDGMVMPGVTKLPRYVVQKGTAATLDFAAVAAQAARILKAFNKQLPGLADSCKRAAEKAWQWALQNPKMIYNQNEINNKFEPKITTGGYGDFNFTDEWFWAACELLATTGEDKYLDSLKQSWTAPLTIPSWNNVRMLGYYTLIRNEKKLLTKMPMELEGAKNKIVVLANNLVSNGGDKPYQSIIGQLRGDFIWGSNSVAMNQSIALIYAYQVTKDNKYLLYALSNLDYVMGRNATGFCYVTGLGTKSTMHPHHRPSVADGIEEPVPGLLAGGPNPGQQDRCAGYPSRMPAESYLDADCSYASNEIAINWNAPLVYVANALEALQKQLIINSK